MCIVGTNALVNDPVAVLAEDCGKVAAAEEERLGRRCHGRRPRPVLARELPDSPEAWTWAWVWVWARENADLAGRTQARRHATVATGLRKRGHRVVAGGGADEADPVARPPKEAGLLGTDVPGGDLPFGRLSAPVVADAFVADALLVDAFVADALLADAFVADALLVDASVADARAVVGGGTGVADLAVAHVARSVPPGGPVRPSCRRPPADPRPQVPWRPDPGGDPLGRRTDPPATDPPVTDRPALPCIRPEDIRDALGRFTGAS